MNDLLDSAHTWYFESAHHELNGALVIRLVEGIKASERQFVEIGETKLGPHFPVHVESGSRCVDVRFENALAFFVVDESYDGGNSEMVRGPGQFLFTAQSSSFGVFAQQSTLVKQLHVGPYEEFVLWCEDRLFHVLSAKAPQVELSDERPNLALERVRTWSAS